MGSLGSLEKKDGADTSLLTSKNPAVLSSLSQGDSLHSCQICENIRVWDSPFWGVISHTYFGDIEYNAPLARLQNRCGSYPHSVLPYFLGIYYNVLYVCESCTFCVSRKHSLN